MRARSYRCRVRQRCSQFAGPRPHSAEAKTSRATRTKKALSHVAGTPGLGPPRTHTRHLAPALLMRSRAFVVRVPHAQCRTMGVQVVVMQDTLLVWCGAVPSDIDDEARDGAYAGALSRDWSVAMHVPPSTTMATPLYHARNHDDLSRRMSERLGTLSCVAHISDEARSAPIVSFLRYTRRTDGERPGFAGARRCTRSPGP